MLTALTRECFDIGGLVPPVYAAWREAIVESLDVYLRALSPRSLSVVVTEQATLPLDTPAAVRLVHLMHLRPALHKLGQVLARHRELDADVRAALQALEVLEPRTPVEWLRPVIEEDLGADVLRRYHVALGAEVLAEGSVAVVLPCVWVDPDDPGVARRAVLKVLRPGVAEDLAEDLEALAAVAGFLEEWQTRGHCSGGPAAPLREMIEDVAALLRREVRLDGEREHLRAAAAELRRCKGVVVPRLCPFQGRRVTAMQHVDGRKITDAALNGDAQREVVRRLVWALLVTPMLAGNGATLFHGDPHAGNLMVDDAGRLVVLDWSLADHLSAADRAALAALAVAAACRDVEGIVRGVMALATCDESRAAEAAVRVVVERALQWPEAAGVGAVAGVPGVPGVGCVMRVVDALAALGLRFPRRFLLLRKVVFTLEGVVADVCPGATLDELVLGAAVGQMVAEAPLRLWLPPMSRAAPSGVSTLDVWRVASSWVTQAFVQWTQLWATPAR